jgi:hypothetical protein
LDRTLKEDAGSVRPNSLSHVELFWLTKTGKDPSAALQTLMSSKEGVGGGQCVKDVCACVREEEEGEMEIEGRPVLLTYKLKSLEILTDSLLFILIHEGFQTLLSMTVMS